MRIPSFEDGAITKFLIEYDREIERFKKNTMAANSGNRALLLYSPSAMVFEVKVTDAGALTVVKVSDG
jgi:hypothetical protein